jgi:hypothetical protein
MKKGRKMSISKLSLFVLVVLALGLTACQPPAPLTENPVSPVIATEEPTQPAMTDTATPPTTGILAVEIVYSGHWYRETFNYQPDAPNIRHIVLVLPVDHQLTGERPGPLFSWLKFTPSPEPLAFRDELLENKPMLEFFHDAPKGIASVELVPGKYNVAVAFIAAALPPPDADALLYPGVTGGGASTDYQVVEILAGETAQLFVELTDDNGWGWLNELAFE